MTRSDFSIPLDQAPPIILEMRVLGEIREWLKRKSN